MKSEILQAVQFTSEPFDLDFKFEAGTSRGVLTQKRAYWVKASQNGERDIFGIGEAAPLPKLSIDDISDFEAILADLCETISGAAIPADAAHIFEWVEKHVPQNLPSVRFAFETALLDLANGGKRTVFDSAFVQDHESIAINGLIWMGKKEDMLAQIEQKLQEGFTCIKIKIGALDFEQECSVLEFIRARFSNKEIEIRVDANGAFTPEEALRKLERLSAYALHSIEQPIRQGQWDAMEQLCIASPVPVALDEELIGVFGSDNKRMLLEKLKPRYIIIKPSLLGGIQESAAWIELASALGIEWWITSALEGNVGLNAIAQFTATYQPRLPQGLGTGQLFHNNVESPLTVAMGELFYDRKKSWGI
jgi:o-succinylbenzoate synthase